MMFMGFWDCGDWEEEREERAKAAGRAEAAIAVLVVATDLKNAILLSRPFVLDTL